MLFLARVLGVALEDLFPRSVSLTKVGPQFQSGRKISLYPTRADKWDKDSNPRGCQRCQSFVFRRTAHYTYHSLTQIIWSVSVFMASPVRLFGDLWEVDSVAGRRILLRGWLS